MRPAKKTSPFWEDKPVPMDDFFHVMKEHIDNHHVVAASMDGSPEKTEDHITMKDGGCGMRKLPAWQGSCEEVSNVNPGLINHGLLIRVFLQ